MYIIVCCILLKSVEILSFLITETLPVILKKIDDIYFREKKNIKGGNIYIHIYCDIFKYRDLFVVPHYIHYLLNCKL